MNRRQLLARLLGGSVALAAADIWLPGEKSIFLPPRRRWATCAPLSCENETVVYLNIYGHPSRRLKDAPIVTTNDGDLPVASQCSYSAGKTVFVYRLPNSNRHPALTITGPSHMSGMAMGIQAVYVSEYT